MQHSSTPWWKTENYRLSVDLPSNIADHAGPHGIALVRAWPDGRTDKGWGGDTFMEHYVKGDFNHRRVLYGYNRDKWAFAIIMRSLNLVAVDIDGKNGGFEHAKKLMLPPTLAETSKSGDGYHLFYSVDKPWDDVTGFAALGDRIGFELWNDRPVVPLPEHIRERLTNREQKIAATQARISSVLASGDDLEVLMMHDDILSRLAAPIPVGKRNNTLFAIGSEMQSAGIGDWDAKLYDRATELGLSGDETQKLIDNIGKYAAVAP
jgi:Bifunctional DNA primase/polymerase, N-terminal